MEGKTQSLQVMHKILSNCSTEAIEMADDPSQVVLLSDIN